MNETIQTIRRNLQEKLQANEGPGVSLEDYKRYISVVRDAENEMKSFIRTYDFAGIDEEIWFFKEVVPSILKWDHYFNWRFELEVERRGRRKNGFRKYIRAELKAMDRILRKNSLLHEYILRGEVLMDRILFIRGSETDPSLDDRFCTKTSKLLSEVLAARMYGQALALEDEGVEGRVGAAQEGSVSFEFTGTDADLAEIVVPIHALKLIKVGGKEVTQEWLLEQVDKLFGREVRKNFSSIDIRNRARKRSQTPFMEAWIDAYLKRSDRLLK